MRLAFLLLPLLAGSLVGRPARAQAPARPTPPPAATPAGCTAVSGYVTHDAQPLGGVSVLVRGTTLLTTTNSEGYFVLPLKSTTQGELFVEAAGYEPQTLPLTCQALQVELRLLPGTRIRQRGKRKGQIKKFGASPASPLPPGNR